MHSADDSNQDVGVAAGDKAAQLALELARERSQRQKAESDFEVSPIKTL